MRERLKGVLIAATLWAGLVTLGGPATANYPWRESEGFITMDVNKTYGGGGTLVCPTIKACYIRVLENEQRGATEYCESIMIKRDGIVVWQRDYNDPYWIAIRDLKGHDRAWFNK
jgi:hypothetical protein